VSSKRGKDVQQNMELRCHNVRGQFHSNCKAKEVANIGLFVARTEANNTAAALRNQILQEWESDQHHCGSYYSTD